MFRPVWKSCLWLAALMVAGWMLSASPAQAGWHHGRNACCGWGGYGYYGYSSAYAYTTSCCSPCATGWGASWYNPSWGCYSGWNSGSAWYNPSWGCYSGGYRPYYSPWYGSYGVASSCCNPVVVGTTVDGGIVPTPASPPPPTLYPQPARQPASVLPSPPPPSAAVTPSGLPANATLFTVVVPEDAQVYVNGLLTKTPGTRRQYISYGLQAGYTYTYVVHAVVTRNGQTREDVQTVRVRAGTEQQVAFDLGGRPNAVVAARLR